MHRTSRQFSLISHSIGILILTLTYAIVGRVALSLAIPPGYATAIFPPAGIAVAVLLIWGNRLWPGVFFGSLLLNIWVSLDNGSISTIALSVAASAAVGATLQALIAVWLIRKFIGYPADLTKEQEIIWFLLLAGPLASIINASVGPSSLLMHDLISISDFTYSWFTWWVGDTLGVFIFTPLVLIFFAQPKSLWRGRRYTVAIPLLVVLMMVLVLFIWISKRENERIQLEFTQAASDVSEKLHSSFTSYVDSVTSIERFLSSTSSVSRQQFHRFVKNTLKQKKGIQGLGWNPIISHAQRDAFINRMRSTGLPEFQITERNSDGILVPAKKHDFYVVATYLEPMKGNQKAIGYDVASNPLRLQALLKARDSGHVVATGRISLVQDKGTQAGFLIFQPVYKGAHNTLAERKQNLYGFAVGVFRVGDIVESVLQQLPSHEFNIMISDITDSGNVTLFDSQQNPATASSGYSFTDNIHIGSRNWLLKFSPSADYLAHHRGWQAWSVLATGLLFTSILGAFLLAMTGRSYQIEKLVKRRTAELSGILATAIETIITIDDKGTIESINPAGEQLIGYSNKELCGHSISTIIPDFFTHKDSSLSAGVRRDTNITCRNGNVVPVEMAISGLTIAERSIYTVIIHDLTERVRTERMKDEFISIVSHELRTPLTSIKGSLGLILGGVLGEQSQKAMNMLGLAHQNIERLEFLINDLLDISKIQSPEHKIKMQTVRVNEFLNKAIVANQGYAERYGIEVILKTELDNSTEVSGDENRLIQVMSNLLSNAIKYSPKGNPVTVSAQIEAPMVKISVTDSGPGIPLEFQDKIFEKFTQADSSDTRRVGGTGLGLTISKAIVEKHGGNIGFHSREGHGSTFYFTLPVLGAEV